MAGVDWAKVGKAVAGATKTLGAGRTVTLRKPSTALVDADKPWLGETSGGVTTFADVPAVKVQVTKADVPEQHRSKRAAGYLIAGPDLGEEPSPEWTLVDGVEMEVVAVETTQPGTVAVLYKLIAVF